MVSFVFGRNLRPKTSGTFWGRGVQGTTSSGPGAVVAGEGRTLVAATVGAAHVGHGTAKRSTAGEMQGNQGALARNLLRTRQKGFIHGKTIHALIR